MLPSAALILLYAITGTSQVIPPPPSPEPIDVVELPLPPGIPSNVTGACTRAINPRGTGCIRLEQGDHEFYAGDFSPDGNHVIVNVAFIGAPEAPDPASIYLGNHAIVVKTDNTTFSNGDPWRCITCGVPPYQARDLQKDRSYPHICRSGQKALWGYNIIECEGQQLSSDNCTPDITHIYPIHWNTDTNGSGKGGEFRELRVHPDDRHIGWNSFTPSGGQRAYFGRLEFNPDPQVGIPLAPRYELVDANLLVDPNRNQYLSVINGSELVFNKDAISIGELRGWSGTGDEILFLGPAQESNNIDVFAVHVMTGEVRRLTSHPEYTDPIASSHDDQWIVVMDTRGSNRQMWMAGMRHIPPLIDVVASRIASGTRNNGFRRFFQPILIDRYGDRGEYFGQQVNYAGDRSNGAINDPNWNGRSDPAFSYDGTRIVYWQTLVVHPQCGGANPLPCPISTSPGHLEVRVMLARLTSRAPTKPPPVFKIPDYIPWATPFPPGASIPADTPILAPGNYTLWGSVSGFAKAQFLGTNTTIHTVAVNYTNYSDDGKHFINGWERVTSSILPPNIWNTHCDWYSDIAQSGAANATKKTSPDGFHITMDVQRNIFDANGTLTTTIDGVEYKQPANGT